MQAGGSGSRAKHCAWATYFSAEMAPDGTITSVRFRPGFATLCWPMSDATFAGGTATRAAIRFTMRDYGSCRVDSGLGWAPRDADRTITVSVIPR